ncbi:MAG: RES family NAD+ phosphorylase [bacterium]
MNLKRLPTTRISEKTYYRIIRTRIPSKELYDEISDNPEETLLLHEIESLTNPRVRQEKGEISVAAREDRLTGAGSSLIMAPFAHVNPEGSRFSDGTYGVFYAGDSIHTAIEETVYHSIRFLLFTQEEAMEFYMRVLSVSLTGELHDIRGRKMPDIYDPEDYGKSSSFGRKLRDQDSIGIIYDSVRNPGGECVAVFRPRVLKNCREMKTLLYQWDGESIQVFERIR